MKGRYFVRIKCHQAGYVLHCFLGAFSCTWDNICFCVSEDKTKEKHQIDVKKKAYNKLSPIALSVIDYKIAVILTGITISLCYFIVLTVKDTVLCHTQEYHLRPRPGRHRCLDIPWKLCSPARHLMRDFYTLLTLL